MAVDCSNWKQDMLIDLLRSSLESHNAEDLKEAIRVLEKKYKRGRKIVMDEVRKYLEQNAIRIGTDFADVLAETLLGIRVTS